MTTSARWKHHPGVRDFRDPVHGPLIQDPLSTWGDYVISHRAQNHTVSYRPRGHHVHVGSYKTEAEAKRAAKSHSKLSLAERLEGENAFTRMTNSSPRHRTSVLGRAARAVGRLFSGPRRRMRSK